MHTCITDNFRIQSTVSQNSNSRIEISTVQKQCKNFKWDRLELVQVSNVNYASCRIDSSYHNATGCCATTCRCNKWAHKIKVKLQLTRNVLPDTWYSVSSNSWMIDIVTARCNYRPMSKALTIQLLMMIRPIWFWWWYRVRDPWRQGSSWWSWTGCNTCWMHVHELLAWCLSIVVQVPSLSLHCLG